MYLIEKDAKPGQLSPLEVILPAGPTGMDASQVEFFGNLNIQTKVVKNQLDIMNPTKILSVGQKITLSEINLMKMFKIKPFKHKIEIKNVYLNSNMYDSSILNINEELFMKRLSQGIENIAAFGLSTGVSNKASAPHSIMNALKNIVGLSIGCGVELTQLKGIQSAPKTEKPKEEKTDDKGKKDDKGGKGKDDKGKDDKGKGKKPEKEPEPEPPADDDVGGLGDMF